MTSSSDINSTTQYSMVNTSEQLVINDSVKDVEVEYYTEAPIATESIKSSSSKEVIINSSMHYSDVLSYTILPKEVKDTKYLVRSRTYVDIIVDLLEASRP